MTAIDLQALGFTNDQIVDRIVEVYVEQLRTEHTWDTDGEKTPVTTTFDREIRKRLHAAIDAKVSAIAEEHVIPKVADLFENLVLQTTNQWGEKRGSSVTFVEYITQRAEAWMTEKVDFEGKSKDEQNGYGWTGTQTRVAHMLHKHLHYTIESGMKDALSKLNSVVSNGIAETIKLKLGEVLAQLKLEVKTK